MNTKIDSLPPIETLLETVYRRLEVLEQEISTLKALILQARDSTKPVRTFKSLRGIWSGFDISEEDIEDAQIKPPDDL